MRRRLVADWWRAGDPDGAVMIAHRRRDVADLNGRAHALMRAAGALGDEEVAVGGARRGRRPRACCGGTTAGSASSTASAGVVGVDASDGELDVELRGRRVRLTGSTSRTP